MIVAISIKNRVAYVAPIRIDDKPTIEEMIKERFGVCSVVWNIRPRSDSRVIRLRRNR